MTAPTVTATAVLRAVTAAGRTGTVAQTGGGCATVYVGDPGPDGRYAALIGPGSYDWSDGALSVFTLDDLWIGADDDGDLPPVPVLTLEDITRYLVDL